MDISTKEVVTKPVNTAQPVQQQKVVTKPVHTAQPIQQEVVTKSVDAAQPIQQVPGTQQPEDRHEQVVVEDPIASQDQVHLSMDNNNLLLSPKTLRDVQEASKLMEDEDTSSTEVLKLPRDTTYGMEEDVPDLASVRM